MLFQRPRVPVQKRSGLFRSCTEGFKHLGSLGFFTLLGGSWVAISGVISPLTWVTNSSYPTHNPTYNIITIHEPPSRISVCRAFTILGSDGPFLASGIWALGFSRALASLM